MSAPLEPGMMRVPGGLPPGGAQAEAADAHRMALVAFVAAVRRRRVAYDLAVAIAAGAAGAVVLAGAAALVAHVDAGARWMSGPLVAGLALAAAMTGVASTVAARARYWREGALVELIEAERPACANLLITAHQLTREPQRGRVSAYVRSRVLSDAARVAASIDVGDLLSWRVVANVAGLAAIAALAAVGMFVRAVSALPDAHTRASAGTAASASTSARDARASGARGVGPAVIHGVSIELIPPAYTGLPTSTLREPERLDVLDGSRLRVRVDASADAVDIELNDVARRPAARGGDGAFAQELTPAQSGVLVISARTRGGGAGAASAAGAGAAAGTNTDSGVGMGTNTIEVADARRLIAISVIADHPPTVALSSPGHDLLASNADGRVRFAADATDDYGLRTLTLHYTKVSGSGERFEFKEAELPLTVTRTNARQWRGVAERSLKELGLGMDDTLVYYAAATDNRPGQERAVSDSYVIEIGQPNAAIVGGFAVPKDEDVFAISLNALIQKTERLHSRRTTMDARAFGEAAMSLAIEQRMVRSEFLFSMGTHGRVEDEEEEAENSNEIQEGRLKNRGQSELAQAVDFMTQAERDLTTANTGDALKAQRAALAAVQRAQSRQRYFLRTMPTPSRIDPARRLTGNLSEASSSHHPASTMPADARAAAIRTLLADCARLAAAIDATTATTAATGTLAATGAAAGTGAAAASGAVAAMRTSVPSASASQLASDMAARMIALDPASAPLRAAAGSLLQVASLLARGRAGEARAIVGSAAAAVMPLAQRGAAAQPAAWSGGDEAIDPALRGAMIDALRRPGGAR